MEGLGRRGTNGKGDQSGRAMRRGKARDCDIPEAKGEEPSPGEAGELLGTTAEGQGRGGEQGCTHHRGKVRFLSRPMRFLLMVVEQGTASRWWELLGRVGTHWLFLLAFCSLGKHGKPPPPTSQATAVHPGALAAGLCGGIAPRKRSGMGGQCSEAWQTQPWGSTPSARLASPAARKAS